MNTMNTTQKSAKEILARLSPVAVKAATSKEATQFVKDAAAKHLKSYKVTVRGPVHEGDPSIGVNIKTPLGEILLWLCLDGKEVYIENADYAVQFADEALQSASVLDLSVITGKGNFKRLDKAFGNTTKAIEKLEESIQLYKKLCADLYNFLGALENGQL